MAMNAAHVHLLLNHIPTTGFGLGLAIFVIGLVWKHEFLTRIGLVLLFLMALLSIAAYVSGNAAQLLMEDRTDVSQVRIQLHEDAVLPAYAFMMITGFAAWVALWQFRLRARLPRWNLAVVLLLGLVSFGLMARAADMGGEIRHPEVRSGTLAAGGTAPGGATQAIVSLVADHTWVRPACEVLHFSGMAILFTVVLLVDLRMLGMAKSWSFASLYQLLPLGILGFGLNWMTGMIFFLATPDDFMKNSVFFWKIGLIMLAGLNALYFTLFDEPWTVGSGDDAPLTTKAVALSAICLWAVIVFLGQMLPFLGHAF